MGTSEFTLEHRCTVYAVIAKGGTNDDAAAEIGVGISTFRSWLTRGRKPESDEAYREFAIVIDRLRKVEHDRTPLDRDELLEQVSLSARKGSVAAQKLAWEILKSDDAGDRKANPLGPLDALAERRGGVGARS